MNEWIYNMYRKDTGKSVLTTLSIKNFKKQQKKIIFCPLTFLGVKEKLYIEDLNCGKVSHEI